jgi:hypothetical protein
MISATHLQTSQGKLFVKQFVPLAKPLPVIVPHEQYVGSWSGDCEYCGKSMSALHNVPNGFFRGIIACDDHVKYAVHDIKMYCKKQWITITDDLLGKLGLTDCRRVLRSNGNISSDWKLTCKKSRKDLERDYTFAIHRNGLIDDWMIHLSAADEGSTAGKICPLKDIIRLNGGVIDFESVLKKHEE